MSEPNDRDTILRLIRDVVNVTGDDVQSRREGIAELYLHQYREEIAAQAKHALRTRHDYDFRCDDCGAPHNLDTSIPSPIWNAICENREGIKPGAAGIGMKEVGALCTLCIEERLVKAGLTCEAEFYFSGKALQSKLYALPSTGNLEQAKREGAREALEKAAQTADSCTNCHNPEMPGLCCVAVSQAIRALLPPGEPQGGQGE